VRRRAKHIIRLQNNEGILSELKTNPVVKKTQNYINKDCEMFGEWTETDCHTEL